MKYRCSFDHKLCVFEDPKALTEDCVYAEALEREQKGADHCPHREIGPHQPIDWEAKYREAVKLANEALDLVEPAFDAGVNGEHGAEQSESREAIRTQLEALEKNA